MVVIQVSGVVGSGRKYLCEKLKKTVKCFDADAILREADDKLHTLVKTKKTKLTHNQENVIAMADEEIKKIINRESNKHEVIVFTGLRMYVKHCNMRYFIKINNFEDTFRRFQLREFNKFIKASTSIKNIIKKSKITDIRPKVLKEMSLSAPFPCNYSEYLSEYETELYYAKAEKAIIKSQSDIIKEINKIA
jgi:hypothetical protein